MTLKSLGPYSVGLAPEDDISAAGDGAFVRMGEKLELWSQTD